MEPSKRAFVRQRAGSRCEYCKLPENAVPYMVFHVDHIIAKQHLDELSDDPQGLAWACSECNYHKGPNLASIDPQSKSQVSLFDPRNDDWDQHFELVNGAIVGRTAVGRATARLLNMNSPRIIRLRLELIELGEF
jgi:hypothetical protein